MGRMFYYLDFQTSAEDRFYRMIFEVVAARQKGWLHLRRIQHQFENSAPLIIQDPRIYKARKNAKYGGASFTDQGWQFDLSSSEVFPDLALIHGS